MKRLIKNPLAFSSVILVIVGLFLPVTAYLGYRNNLANLERMLGSRGEAMLEAVLHEAENAILADREVLDILEGRLEDNLLYLMSMHERGELDAGRLGDLVERAGLVRFDIYGAEGGLLLTSDPARAPLFIPDRITAMLPDSGTAVTLLDSGAPDSAGQLMALARALPGRPTGVAYLDARRLSQFRRRIGIGLLLDDIASVQGVVYAALQDSLGIISASSEVISLSSIGEDDFFPLPAGEARGRFSEFQGQEVYETAGAFQLGGEHYGYFRVGLSTVEIRTIAAQDRRRFFLGMLVFAVLIVVVAGLYYAGRSRLRLELEHSRIKGFSDSVLEGMTEAVVVIDERDSIVLMNQACGSLCGCRADRTGEKLSGINPPLAGMVRRMEEAGLSTAETTLEVPEGESRPVLVSMTPLEIGERRYRTLILRDLTDRREAEKLALRNQRYKTMAEVSAGVAHEIRNPLNSIAMNVQRLKLEFSPAEGPEREEYAGFIDTIRAEVERLDNIVQQFLALARFPEPRLEPARFDRLIGETLEFLHPEITGRGLALDSEIETAPESLFDPAQMKQVLTNLIGNAADAADGTGGGKIRVAGSNARGVYRIAVSDNGPGIGERERERIFEPFFSTKNTGSGLGLAIVQRIVNEHGGSIGVHSRPGEGAEFIVEMPLKLP